MKDEHQKQHFQHILALVGAEFIVGKFETFSFAVIF